jgi:hypothetical protein
MLAVDGEQSALIAAGGGGWTKLVMKQRRKIPAIDETSEPLPPAGFSRGVALGRIVVPSGTESVIAARAWPKVDANESPPLGVPPKALEAASVATAAAAGWTGRDSIKSLATRQGAGATPNTAPMAGLQIKGGNL